MSVWQTMTPQQKVTACKIDISNHPQFSMLSGFMNIGNTQITDELPTAATNGIDMLFNPDLVNEQSRQQLRYIVCHEAMHIGLKHCSEYRAIVKKHPMETNMAMDYVINLMIEDTDKSGGFVDRPTVEPLIDEKYRGMSFLEVLDDLLKNPPPDGHWPVGKGEGGKGKAGDEKQGHGGFDMHLDMPEDVDTDEHDRRVADAARQGQTLQRKLAGNGKGGNPLDSMIQQRKTDWRDALRQFVTTVCEGDEYSRFNPPNKRMLASGILMPSHFSESSGEIIIAGDTSGSMSEYYGMILGEVAQICKTANPERVRMLWWDTSVCAEQIFKPSDYDRIGTLLKPKGGGGTHPACVTRYIQQHNLQPKAIVWLTDGYLDGSATQTSIPQLWGVVRNERFVAPQGKVVHIN